MTYLEELGVLKLRMKEGSENVEAEPRWNIEVGPLFEIACDLYRAVHEEYDSEKELLALFCFGTFWETHISGGKPSGLIQIFKEAQQADYGNQVIDLKIKVRHAKCFRVVRMNLSDTLFSLHLMIHKVFDIDEDHLFAFYTGRGMTKETFTKPEAFISNDEFSVYDTELGDLCLRKGEKFCYLFDFMTECWFDIQVMEINEGSSVSAPELIRAVHDTPWHHTSPHEF